MKGYNLATSASRVVPKHRRARIVQHRGGSGLPDRRGPPRRFRHQKSLAGAHWSVPSKCPER